MQVTLCEQVQAYLSRFQSDSDKAAAEAPAKADIAPLQGMAIYSKKKVSTAADCCASLKD